MGKIQLLKSMTLTDLCVSLNLSKDELRSICLDMFIPINEKKRFDQIDIQDIADNLGLQIEFYDPNPNSQLSIKIDPGTASSEDLAGLIADISILYRKLGGGGINLSFEGIHVVEENSVEA